MFGKNSCNVAAIVAKIPSFRFRNDCGSEKMGEMSVESWQSQLGDPESYGTRRIAVVACH